MLDKATATSFIRALLLLFTGYFGQQLSEKQINEAAVAGGALVVLAGSVIWARRDDKKLLNTVPPLPER